MKKKLVFTAAMVAVLVLGAQAVFAADYDLDFAKLLRKNDINGIERLLQRRSNQMDLSCCLMTLFNRDINKNPNNTLPIIQLLVRYGVDLKRGGQSFSWSGADLYKSSGLGYPLEYTHDKSTPVIRYLLENGADPSKNSMGVLRSAFDDNDLTMARLAIERGADINARNTLGDTLLMQNAYAGRLNVVQFLIQNGANVNLRNHAGSTAASVAYDSGNIEIYNYLKANGAIDFEPRQVTQQPTAPAQSTTNVYVQQPAQPAPAPAPSAPKATTYTVMVYYMDNTTRKSTFEVVTATSKSEAEREAERKWKQINGYNNKLRFLEAVCN